MKQALILEDMPESQEMLREVVQTVFVDVSVHSVADVASAMRLIKTLDFDLALIDLALPDGDGTTVVQAMSLRFPDCMIVVASLFDDDGHLFPALRAGAHGYLLKDQTPEKLITQLRGINDGYPPLSPSVARRLLGHFREIPSSPAVQAPTLTPREREVLIHLTRGTGVAKIGIAMGISRHTVGDHVKNLYRKLKISSRAEAALQAKSLGLVQTER
jgi:DNA-binding NarL/FixJ family response regulator